MSGRLDVGTGGLGGVLMTQDARVEIYGVFDVGSARSNGEVFGSNTDTLVTGGTLSAGQTGIAAESIVVGGDGSSISIGGLDVEPGGAAHDSSRGSLAINNGAVRVAGDATINGVVRLGEGGLLVAQTITLNGITDVLGSGTLSGNIVANGAITVGGGTLICMGPASGDGVFKLSDGTLQFGATDTAGVAFGNAGTIVSPSISDLTGPLSGWQAGDTILFTAQAIAFDSYANGTLTLFDSMHHLLGTEMFTGSLDNQNFELTSEQGTGTLLSFHQ